MIAAGTRIFASVVKPGMVIDLDGEPFPVGATREGYSTFSFDNDGRYRSITVEYGAMVKLLGYFNPESYG